jgi:hypothetical protein
MRVLHARDSVLVWSVSLGLIYLACVSIGGLQDVHSLLLTASEFRIDFIVHRLFVRFYQ